MRSASAGVSATRGAGADTEEFILGQLYARALRAKGFKVTLMNNLGTSEVVERKLTSGRLDAYPEDIITP